MAPVSRNDSVYFIASGMYNSKVPTWPRVATVLIGEVASVTGKVIFMVEEGLRVLWLLTAAS